MRFPLAVLGLLVGLVPATGEDVRAASDMEMVGLLSGCWRQERAPDKMSELFDAAHYDVCFGEKGSLTTPIVTCSVQHGCTDDVGRGRYGVADAKLHIAVDEDWGFIFGRPNLSCDVLAAPGRAIKLMNCVGSGFSWKSGPEILPDTSYAFVAMAVDQ